MKINLNIGDVLYEPLSDNTGEITKIINHPDGQLVNIRWRREGQLHHDTEQFHSKLVKCIKRGEIHYTPKAKP
ncbi:MAG: hypothetical protein ACE5G9_03700 [Nitrospinales bacterium]